MALPPRLQALHITRRFGSLTALDDVSFEIPSGGFLVVLGPNGAGKTTLVRILARLGRPSSGEVILDDEEWLGAPPERQREVGVLSHATYLYDGLTALENLRFYGVLYGLDDPATAARAALEAVGLESHADRRAGTLSRGPAPRMAIARAVLHEPRLLLLDEPFAGLDPHAAARLGETLDALARAGRTILLTTHDLGRIPSSARAYLVLVDGRVRAAGRWPPARDTSVETLYRDAVADAAALAGDA